MTSTRGELGDRNAEWMTLSVEGVDLVAVTVVKAFEREILFVALQLNPLLPTNLPSFMIIEEMMMCQCGRME